MYRSDLGAKDRSGAIAAVVAIHAALLFAFLNISGKLDFKDAQRALSVFDVIPPQPPPPPPPQPARQQPKDKEARSADRSGGDRFGNLQPRLRTASVPSRAQSSGSAGCRLVRIRATTAAVIRGV